MAKTDRLQVRIDPNEKQLATKVFESCGLSLSEAVSLFIRQSVNTGRIPFSVDYLPVSQTRQISTK